jgi:hypothetical protein
MNRNYFKPHKADKENSRALKRAEKAERLAIRRAERLQGVEIKTLPEDLQSLARTLSNG